MLKILVLEMIIYNYINNKGKDILDLVELSHDECLELFNEYKEKNKEIY